MTADKKTITLPPVLTVKELAERLDRSVAEVISVLVRYGVMASINEDIDFDTAAVVAEEFGLALAPAAEAAQPTTKTTTASPPAGSPGRQPRPAVVTVMGHIDHGKTTLLDAIRHTNVAAGEAGGITQSISSYQVEVADPTHPTQKRSLTFLDTPGHSAFEAMRKHGVSLTDLVVLVVAANEGVKPQTVEAIKHAQALKVPLVVAVNKIDLPNADVERVKRELAEREVMPEEWGGQVPVVPVAATKGENIDKLLEVVLLATDLLSLTTDPVSPAAGVVIEAHLESGLGPVATILVQNGTLQAGQIVVIGDAYGKVRSLEDYRGRRLRQATAAMPVRLAGLSAVPSFGERLIIVSTEKEAREIARQNAAAKRRLNLSSSIAALSQSSQTKEGHLELSLVVKANTQGSLNAILDLAQNASNEDVVVTVVKAGVGELSEEDISRARSTKATVLGFNVKVSAAVKKMAVENAVSIHNFSVIYELEQLILQAVAALMPEVEVEREVATVQVLKRFRDNRKHAVLGGLVLTGELRTGQQVVIGRSGATEPVASGEIVRLQVGQEERPAVKEGHECGVELAVASGDQTAIQEKDVLRVLTVEKIKKTI